MEGCDNDHEPTDTLTVTGPTLSDVLNHLMEGISENLDGIYAQCMNY